MLLTLSLLCSAFAWDPPTSFCIPRTYGKGLGSFHTQCPVNTSRIGLLCYPPCRENHHDVGLLCREFCNGTLKYECKSKQGCSVDKSTCESGIFYSVKRCATLENQLAAKAVLSITSVAISSSIIAGTSSLNAQPTTISESQEQVSNSSFKNGLSLVQGPSLPSADGISPMEASNSNAAAGTEDGFAEKLALGDKDSQLIIQGDVMKISDSGSNVATQVNDNYIEPLFSTPEVTGYVQYIHQSLGSSWFPSKSIDTAALIAIFSSLTELQIAKISNAYEGSYGVALYDMVHKKTSGILRQTLLLLIMPVAFLDATMAHTAIYQIIHLDTKSLALIFIGRSNSELKTMKAVYMKLYQEELTDNIISKTNEPLRSFFDSVLQADRDETGTIQVVSDDVSALYVANPRLETTVLNAGDLDLPASIRHSFERWFAVYKDIYFEILNMRSVEHLRLVINQYEQTYNQPLIDAIGFYFRGELKTNLIATVRSVENRALFLASEIHDSMGNIDRLMYLVVRNRNPVLLEGIKREYYKAFEKDGNKTLYQDIGASTSGDFRNVLLSIVGN